MRYRVRPQDEGGISDWLVGLISHVVELGIVLLLVLVLLLVAVRAVGGH